MATYDLRDWLEEVEQLGQLQRIDGADWDQEIGALSALNVRRKTSPVFLFDNIKGYPGGYRVVTGSTANAATVGLTYGLPTNYSDAELSRAMAEKVPQWESRLGKSTPQVVETGPIMENVLAGNDIDVLKFPTPKWNDLDGGRYIGTGNAVITRDPDTGEVNLGTYRIMIHDKNTVGLHISPGKDGRIHLEKHHARGEACPVAVSVGHHPLMYRIACTTVPFSEYSFIGAIMGEPVKVIKEEVTGLPIPADSEIVIAGWSPPGKDKKEGPFGEFTGYYAGGEREIPIIEVERLYHRNTPIILGSPPHRIRDDSTYHGLVIRSAMMYNELVKNGIADVRGVWVGAGGMRLIIVSLKQRYAGHAKRAALIASQSVTGAYIGRYVIVVDEDIDPSNIEEVLWALCTRSDPEKDIDIIRKCWSTALDPIIRKPTNAFYNTRAIIDACKPYDWIDEFPQSVELSPELESRMKEKWGTILNL
jgi:UbiD family decarboxylase